MCGGGERGREEREMEKEGREGKERGREEREGREERRERGCHKYKKINTGVFLSLLCTLFSETGPHGSSVVG